MFLHPSKPNQVLFQYTHGSLFHTIIYLVPSKQTKISSWPRWELPKINSVLQKTTVWVSFLFYQNTHTGSQSLHNF